MLPPSKNMQVKIFVANGEYKKALQICKDWIYEDEEDRRILRRGYECLVHPRFYEELGIDPSTSYQEAVNVLIRLYS